MTPLDALLDAVWLDLGSSKTYASRQAFVVPMDLQSGTCDGRHATVKIYQRAAKRASGKVDEDAYAVEYLGRAVGFPGWQFLFNNLNPKPAEVRNGQDTGPYLVSVGPHVSECTCKAGQCKVNVCKHRGVAERIVADHLLPAVEDAEPAAA